MQALKSSDHAVGARVRWPVEKQMTGRPGISRFLACAALMGVFAGCRTPTTEPQTTQLSVGPVDPRTGEATVTLVPQDGAGAALPEATTQQKATALLTTSPTAEPQALAASSLTGIAKLPRFRSPVLIREDSDTPKLSTQLPPAPNDLFAIAVPPSDAPVKESAPSPLVPMPATKEQPPVPDTPPAELPPLGGAPTLLPGGDGSVGPIFVGDHALTFDSLSKMVDGQGCTMGSGGCSSCGDCPPGRPCAAGAKKCEPFPLTHNPLNRFVALLYENICCPDPCYQPKWEPIADSAFFVDGARPNNNTRFRWDYGDHLTYPDRGEFFWARADGKGKGPKAALTTVKAVPYLDYHELSIVSEIAAGPASAAISLPYRSVSASPFGNDSAGFADMTITAKSLLVDSELFLCALQFRTFIPTGNFGKGLGTGHVSLEPGLLFGLRLTPETYLQGQVLEWIPIAGDPSYAGAALLWGVSANHLLWQPVKDVQLIGTLELNGTSFQDGLYTDPVLGPQKLSGQNALSLGNGYRIFFCNTFDVGAAIDFGITGKYMVRDQLRFEMRFRY